MSEDIMVFILGIAIGLLIAFLTEWIRISNMEIGYLLVDESNLEKDTYRFVFSCPVEDIKTKTRVLMKIEIRDLNSPYNEDQEGL